jgi:hypothetical protein
MGTLTTTKGRSRKVGVTRPTDADVAESSAILFAMRVADLSWSTRQVYELTFGKMRRNGWALPPELRARTERELDALAALDPQHPPSHDADRRDGVLCRILEDGRLRKIEGVGHATLFSEPGFRIHWVPILTSAEEMIDYGLAMLLDVSQPWGQMFFRCQLESCNRFFIAERPKYKGQFRYKYCSPEHQKAADATMVAERVRRFRERQKESKR